MKHLVLATTILLAAHPTIAAEVIPDFIWVQPSNVGASCKATLDLVVDNSGNSFLTGHFTGTTDFGGTSLIATGYSDIFLLKYDADGNLAWVRQDGGSSTSTLNCDQGEGVTIDGSGNLLVTGTFSDTSYFDTDSLVSAGAGDMFLAKYDGSGNVVWITRAGGAERDFGRDIAIDPSDDVFVVGEFRVTASVGDTSFTSPGVNSPDIFVAKYSSDGTFLWARHGTSAKQVIEPVIATDGSGNCIITGRYTDSIDFDGNVLSETGTHVFLTKYDGSGNVLWTRTSSGTGYDIGSDIDTGSSDDIYVTGSFMTTVNFGDTTLNSVNTVYPEAFTVKYANNGDFIWARGIAGVIANFDQIEGKGISISSEDACLVTGFYIGSAVFADTTLSNYIPLSARGFAARYESDGAFTWAYDVGAGASGFVTASDPDNNVFLGGVFNSAIMFGDSLVTASGFSIYYAKYGDVVASSVAYPGWASNRVTLFQNAPNPFNPSTRISYSLDRGRHVRLSVFDVRGRRVATLVDESKMTGRHSVLWDAATMPSGVYFYRIEAGDAIETRKMVLLK